MIPFDGLSSHNEQLNGFIDGSKLGLLLGSADGMMLGNALRYFKGLDEGAMDGKEEQQNIPS